MENLNAEQVKKGLECHANGCKCSQCPMPKRTKEHHLCWTELSKATLALINSQEQRIKELTEENERLRGFNSAKCEDCAGCTSWKCDCENIEAYAVEKYKSAIIEYYSKPKYQPTKEHPIKHTQIEYLFAVLDQIAKEMLEGE